MLKATPTDTIAAINAPDNGSVLMFDGRAYAVGLLWLTVQEGADRDLLQERIKKTGADFHCKRTHVAQQQGFAWLSKGHRRGMPVAAAMVADQLVGEWHGVFEADNGWWYVQVRSDTITPNGDRFFASEEDAFHHFQEEAQKNIWPHSYAPERWRLTDAQTRELSLRNLLDDLTTTTLIPNNLTAFMGSAAMRNTVLLGALICAAVVAAILAHALLKPPAAPPLRKRPQQTIDTPQAKNQAEIVSPIQLLQQCGEAADRLYTPLAGWATESFICSAGTASMTWRQDGGRLSTARDTGAKHWPQNAVITMRDRRITVEVSLANLPKLEAVDLLPQDVALMYLEENFQALGNLNVKPVTPRPPRAENRGNNARNNRRNNTPPPPPPPPPPPYLEIQFSSGYSPEQIGPLLDARGLELQKVEWRIPQSTWQYNLKWIHQSAAKQNSRTSSGSSRAKAR